ncbi:TonB-dependent receptor plug domain-containing protein [Luteibacter sp. PPL552]
MKHFSHMLKRKPLCAALAAATLSLAGYVTLPTSAFAQDAAPAATTDPAPAAKTTLKNDKTKNSPTNLDTVVVTSYRQSIDQNVLDKRDANSIVEVINAQNIAQFPAKNIADALAHVPGVVISRESGEGKTVSIRGLAPELTLTS